MAVPENPDRRLSPIPAEHGKNAVAVYIGNPNARNLSLSGSAVLNGIPVELAPARA